jgi:ABC-type amino acid transport substrate-binding protein
MISEAIANGVLKDTGAEVIEYANGPLAMAAMKSGRYDVVVIDELPAKKLVK